MLKTLRLTIAFFILPIVANAGFIAPTVTGTQSIVDLAGPTADTGNILTASSFTLGDIYTASSTNGASGDFKTNFVRLSELGTDVIFKPTNPGLFSFGNTTFGFFTATSILFQSSTNGASSSINYYAYGNYTPGSVLQTAGFTGGAQSASILMSFNQNKGAISDNMVMVTPAQQAPLVPEPASAAYLALGALTIAVVRHLRRKHA